MSDNPLMQTTALDVSPEQERRQAVELMETTDTSLYDLQRRKADIERKRQDLDIDRKEQNLESVDWLNQRIYGLISSVTDPDMTERIAANVKDGKDLNEMVKAVSGVVKLRDDMLDHTYDDTANTGKKKKIEFAFQGQGLKMAMRVESDG